MMELGGKVKNWMIALRPITRRATVSSPPFEYHQLGCTGKKRDASANLHAARAAFVFQPSLISNLIFSSFSPGKLKLLAREADRD